MARPQVIVGDHNLQAMETKGARNASKFWFLFFFEPPLSCVSFRITFTPYVFLCTANSFHVLYATFASQLFFLLISNTLETFCDGSIFLFGTIERP